MCFLYSFPCKTLYLAFSLLYTMMLFFCYILFLFLILPITHIMLLLDFFLHNFLSILFLGWYVLWDVLSSAYDSYLLGFLLFHHTFLPISIMIFLIYDIFCMYILYLYCLSMFLPHSLLLLCRGVNIFYSLYSLFQFFCVILLFISDSSPFV